MSKRPREIRMPTVGYAVEHYANGARTKHGDAAASPEQIERVLLALTQDFRVRGVQNPHFAHLELGLTSLGAETILADYPGY